MSNKESGQRFPPWMLGLGSVLLVVVGTTDLLSAEYLDATMEIALGALIFTLLFPGKRWVRAVQLSAAIAVVTWFVLWLVSYLPT